MARAAIAFGLVLCMIAFLYVASRFSEETPAPETQPAPVTPPLPDLSGGPGRAPLVFTSSQQCRDCHSEIYTEWLSDQHASAWTESNFQTFTENYKRVECLSCHAPQPMLQVGIEKDPLLRDTDRTAGVDCLTCHIKDGRVHGTLGSNGACDGILEPQLKTSQACFHCHHTHNLFKEFEASPQFKQGMTCQDCHMAVVERVVSPGGPKRKTRKHFIHGGGHDPEALKKTLSLDLKVEGRTLTATVTNIGAAHGVPGEINNRIVRLEISVLVKQKELFQGKEQEIENEVRAWRRDFQPPPRMARDKIPSTQIMPGEPRVLTFELPVDHGRIEAILTYRLEATLLMAQGVEMGRAEIKF